MKYIITGALIFILNGIANSLCETGIKTSQFYADGKYIVSYLFLNRDELTITFIYRKVVPYTITYYYLRFRQILILRILNFT